MKSQHPLPKTHILLQAIAVLINKFRQHPEVYPVRYYKKGKKFRRSWKSEIV